MTLETTYIQAGEVRAYARVTGEGDSTLVLLHGAEADGSMWEPYMDGLARGRRVMALDLPGHGRSEVAAGMDCSPAGVARWFASVLDSEGVGTAAVLGHSFGGVVAFNLALEAPSRVSHLVGVNVANLAFATSAFRDGAQQLLDGLVGGTLSEDRARELLAGIYRKDPGDADIVAGVEFWSRPGVRRFFANGGVEFSRSLPVWRLREVATPTLLVWGDRDRFFPVDEARTAVMYIPHAKLVVIAGGGHSPFVDAPDTFYMAVDAFVSDVE